MALPRRRSSGCLCQNYDLAHRTQICNFHSIPQTIFLVLKQNKNTSTRSSPTLRLAFYARPSASAFDFVDLCHRLTPILSSSEPSVDKSASDDKRWVEQSMLNTITRNYTARRGLVKFYSKLTEVVCWADICSLGWFGWGFSIAYELCRVLGHRLKAEGKFLLYYTLDNSRVKSQPVLRRFRLCP